MNSEALEEYALDLIYDGKEYDEVKAALLKKLYDEKTINDLLYQLDSHFVNYQLTIQNRSNTINRMIIGGVIFLLGVGVTLYTYLTTRSSYVIAYGAILAGGWVLKEAYKSYQAPIDRNTNRPSKFRRKKFKR